MKHLIILKKTIKILNFHERILIRLISCNIDTKKVTCKAKQIQTNLTAIQTNLTDTNKRKKKKRDKQEKQQISESTITNGFFCSDTAAATLKGVDPAHHKNSFWML